MLCFLKYLKKPKSEFLQDSDDEIEQDESQTSEEIQEGSVDYLKQFMLNVSLCHTVIVGELLVL
jgi:hypothetical protein